MEEIKRKSKVITLKGEDAFIRLLASQFGTTADMEINLIKVLIKFDLFNGFFLDKHLRERMRRELNAPYATLGSSVSRLVKTGIIARNGKTMYFNVAFRGLDELDSIVFKLKN